MCRVVVGRYRVNKWGTDACYLLRTEFLCWVRGLGYCDWVGNINCNNFISSEPLVGTYGVQKWRLCPGDISVLVIMHRKSCKDWFNARVIVLHMNEEGKLVSKVVGDALVNPRDADNFLGELARRLNHTNTMLN